MSSGRSGRTLNVGNLPRDITEIEVEELFYKFEDPREGEDAICGHDDYNFDGNELRVQLAHGGRGSSSYDHPCSSGGGASRGGRGSSRIKYHVIVTGLPSSASWWQLKGHMCQAGGVCFAKVYSDDGGTTGIVDYTNYDDMKHAIRKLDGSVFKNAVSQGFIRVTEYDPERSSYRIPSGSYVHKLRRSNSPKPESWLKSNSPCSSSASKGHSLSRPKVETSHIAPEVPAGDTPYTRAKKALLVGKDPERAILLLSAAIEAGDRVDTALKDMACVLKQQNRAEVAIKAIESLRHKCSFQAQEPLDNILLELYKKSGRLDDEIEVLNKRLYLIEHGLVFNGNKTKTVRSSQGKYQITIQQEKARLLANLGWALMRKEKYKEAEEVYRKSLVIEPDKNKMCNLVICLLKQGKIIEARKKLQQVEAAPLPRIGGVDFHLEAYQRAREMVSELTSKFCDNNNTLFSGSSSVGQLQSCNDNYIAHGKGEVRSNMLNSSNEGVKNKFLELPDDYYFNEAVLFDDILFGQGENKDENGEDAMDKIPMELMSPTRSRSTSI